VGFIGIIKGLPNFWMAFRADANVGWPCLFSALAAVLLLGCSSSELAERDERVQQQLSEEARAAPAEQQEVFADEKISYAEYEQAVLATIECLQNEGLVVDGPHEDLANPGQLVFGYGGTETAEQLDGLDTIYNRCYREHLSVIDTAYAFQIRPSEEEEEARDFAIASCLRERFGVVFPEPRSIKAVRGVLAQEPAFAAECLVVVNSRRADNG